MMPADFPKWRSVYHYFTKWSRDGTLEEIHDVLRKRLRTKCGRKSSPSFGVIDSQNVRTTKIDGEARGFDGGKKVKGRKRHIITDNQGFLLAGRIHSAQEHNSKSGYDVIRSAHYKFGSIRKIYADGGYRGELVETVKKTWFGNRDYLAFGQGDPV